jgi:hypothetical protein
VIRDVFTSKFNQNEGIMNVSAKEVLSFVGGVILIALGLTLIRESVGASGMADFAFNLSGLVAIVVGYTTAEQALMEKEVE